MVALAFAPVALQAQQKCDAVAQKSGALSVDEKWWNFVCETANPLTVAAGLFNGAVAHLTDTDPKYGTNADAFGKRVAASTLDIATQNFAGDFLLASALHEDPRYFRKGPQYGMWSRVGYAVSRGWRIRTDSGGSSFNWSNVLGAAASTGLSYTYYPPASRNGDAMAFEFVSDALGTGFADIAIEFWPDVRQRLFHR